MAIAKWVERNIIHVCQSDKKFSVQDECPNETIKRSDAICGDLNIEVKNT
jgi:hypothetical protein